MGVLKGPGTRRSEGRTGKQRAPSEQRLLTPARFPPRPGRAPAAAGGAGKGQSYRSPLCDGRHSRPGAGARREGGRERDGRPQGRHGRTARTVTAQPGPPTCGRSGGEQRVAPQLPAPLSAARAGAKAQTEPFPCERQGQTQTRPPPPPTHRAGERRLLRGVPADAHRALGGRRAKLSAACGAGGTLRLSRVKSTACPTAEQLLSLYVKGKLAGAYVTGGCAHSLTCLILGTLAPCRHFRSFSAPLQACLLHFAFRVVMADGPGHCQSTE